MSKRTRSRSSILIVEDEPIVAKDLQETLREMGYDAYAIASSADDAIRRATEKCPDLVLMDIRIKGDRDGIQTAEILRQQFGVSVVYLTAHADDATIERAARTAPYGYLLKPIKSAELRSAIEVAAFKQKLDKAIGERERRLTTALDAVSDAVVAVDIAGKVTYLNPAAETLIGATAETAIGKTADQVLQLMTKASETANESSLEVVMQGVHTVGQGEVTQGEVTLRNLSSGLRSSINETSSPILEDGHLLGAVMVLRDVGEKKRMQQQLELADRLASLGTMAAGTAHELNNPLTVVITNSGFLAEELLQMQGDLNATALREVMEKRFKRVFEALGDVQAAASRMGRIVADLRGFARPVEQAYRVMDLRRCIEWAVRATAHEFHHRATLRTRFDAAPVASGESTRLEQVLVNLLVNAAHAIAPGNADQNEVWVSLRTDTEGRAVIEVRDSGGGIRPADLGKIFEPFFTTKAAGSGTGLGLSICHGIVKSLGGDINVASEFGSGTTFTVVLPQAPEKAAEAPTEETAKTAVVRGRVLLIDDETALLRAMQRILEDEEHFVEVTQSARDALAMIERGDRFDLILSDLMMPMMTGVDFYEALLARNPLLAHSVIFVSGGAISAKVDAFLRSVPNLRMEKPFKAAQLRDIVQQGLTRRPGAEPW
jgi:PAS domain S-box-containing protein